MMLQSYIKMMLNLLGIIALTVKLSIAMSIGKLPTKQECPPSHMEFVGLDTLGIQDDLNMTFTYLKDKIKLDTISPQTREKAEYSIYDYQEYRLTYLDKDQKMQILDNNSIKISGGQLKLEIVFKWNITQKQPPYETQLGTGVATTLTDQLSFIKQLRLEDNQYNYYLTECPDIDWWNGKAVWFEVSDFNPPLQQYPQWTFRNLVTSGSYSVENDVYWTFQRWYCFLLKQVLKKKDYPFEPEFKYTWKSREGEPGSVVALSKYPRSIEVKKDGVKNFYTLIVEKDIYLYWKCQEWQVPNQTLDTSKHSEPQQFVGYDFYRNMFSYYSYQLSYTELSSKYWSSALFNFKMGQLYEVFPELKEKYTPTTAVKGYCRSKNPISYVETEDNKTITVFQLYQCGVGIDYHYFLQFTLNVKFYLEGKPSRNEMNFEILKYSYSLRFDKSQFEMKNQTLARQMVDQGLKRIKEVNLFGNGFPIPSYQKEPKFVISPNSTVLFEEKDSSSKKVDFE